MKGITTNFLFDKYYIEPTTTDYTKNISTSLETVFEHVVFNFVLVDFNKSEYSLELNNLSICFFIIFENSDLGFQITSLAAVG